MKRFVDISYCDNIFFYSTDTKKIEKGQSLVMVRKLIKHNFFYFTCILPNKLTTDITTGSFIMNRKTAYESCIKLSSGIIVAADENALPNYIIENNFTKVRDMKGRIRLKNIE